MGHCTEGSPGAAVEQVGNSLAAGKGCPGSSSERTRAGFCGTGGEMWGVKAELPGRHQSAAHTDPCPVLSQSYPVPSSEFRGGDGLGHCWDLPLGHLGV